MCHCRGRTDSLPHQHQQYAREIKQVQVMLQNVKHCTSNISFFMKSKENCRLRHTRQETQTCHHDETSPSSSPSAVQPFSSYMIIIIIISTGTVIIPIVVIIVIITVSIVSIVIIIIILRILPPIGPQPKNSEKQTQRFQNLN